MNKSLAAAAYVAFIVGTNVAFATVGPVALTFVLAGLTMAARDFVHDAGGRRLSFPLVLVGALVSALASPAVALASGVAFLVAETLDMTVYELVRRRTHLGGIALSGIAGSIVDSVLFLTIAFGSLAFLPVQLVGKIAATLGAVAVLAAVRGVRRLLPA